MSVREGEEKEKRADEIQREINCERNQSERIGDGEGARVLLANVHGIEIGTNLGTKAAYYTYVLLLVETNNDKGSISCNIFIIANVILHY